MASAAPAIGPIPLTPLAVAVLCVVFGVAVVTDLRERRVPLWLTTGGIALGLLLGAVLGWDVLQAGLIGMVVGIAILLPFVLLGGIGGGDALLLGVVGTWLGWTFVLWTAWWGSLAGGVLALIALARRQRSFPYVPALAIGALLAPLTAALL